MAAVRLYKALSTHQNLTLFTYVIEVLSAVHFVYSTQAKEVIIVQLYMEDLILPTEVLCGELVLCSSFVLNPWSIGTQ